ncbi:MAG TPA: IS66 family transposase [Caulobacteraceae bacterium]|jgi:transposase
MRADDATLPGDLDTAHRQIREQAETLRQQGQLIAKLQHQLEQLLRQRYGKKSEAVDPDQLLLFARDILAQAEPEPMAPAPPPRTPAESKPESRGHGRKPLPASLPRKRIVHDVAPLDRACPECGGERRLFGEEVREQLEYVPASLIVLAHVRPKYACAGCAAHVVIAQRLPEPIEKGLPGTGLLAHVITSKFADHLPLYRQEGIFQRNGVELARSTLCDWMAACAGLLEPIIKAMLRRILASKVIATDDTPVTVQDHAGKGVKTGRLWAYLGDRDNPFIVYDYTPDRTASGPERFLKDYRSGYLQSDAYAGYDGLHRRGLVEVGCWAHARRRFHEARTSDPERSHAAIAWIGQLYGVERQARDGGWDDATRMAARTERSRPLWESFSAWLEGEAKKVLPKSPVGEAIAYARSNGTALSRYLESPYLSIDNNASENAIRPIALGRKNWLHLGSDRGGCTAATLLSLVQSCKNLGNEPFAYLRDVLDRVSTHPASRIDDLLPDRRVLPVKGPPPGRKG